MFLEAIFPFDIHFLTANLDNLRSFWDECFLLFMSIWPRSFSSFVSSNLFYNFFGLICLCDFIYFSLV